MKRLLVLLSLATLASPLKVLADFGDADFPSSAFSDGPKSYHDAWCRRIKNECRVHFQGSGMWVEGQGGIQSHQYLGFRFDRDGGDYNYVTISRIVVKRATFLFLIRPQSILSNRWKKQVTVYPNYRPQLAKVQDTQGRDKSYGVPITL